MQADDIMRPSRCAASDALSVRGRVKTLGPGLRYEADEVLVALHVLCEHHQVVAAVLLGRGRGGRRR